MSYKVNPLVHVLNATPIDNLARIVAAQKHCVDSGDLTKEDIVKKIAALEVRKKQLSTQIGVRNATHATNIKINFTKKSISPNNKDRDVILEWLLVGKQIQQMCTALANARKEAKARREVKTNV